MLCDSKTIKAARHALFNAQFDARNSMFKHIIFIDSITNNYGYEISTKTGKDIMVPAADAWDLIKESAH